MDSTLTVALAKVVKPPVLKKASGELEPGSYEIDAVFRVHGTLRKGADHEAKATAKIDFKLLALVALSKVNETTRDVIMKDFLAATKAGKDSPERTVMHNQVKDQVMPALQEVADTTVIKKQGAVTATLVADSVAVTVNAKMD